MITSSLPRSGACNLAIRNCAPAKHFFVGLGLTFLSCLLVDIIPDLMLCANAKYEYVPCASTLNAIKTVCLWPLWWKQETTETTNTSFHCSIHAGVLSSSELKISKSENPSAFGEMFKRRWKQLIFAFNKYIIIESKLERCSSDATLKSCNAFMQPEPQKTIKQKKVEK